jgi:cytosine/adenosine deaminase-related metal-dependent hydrolase
MRAVAMSRRGSRLRADSRPPRGAQIFGIADCHVSIESGKEADLVVRPGGPFELTTTVDRVSIPGVALPTDTRQRQPSERYRRTWN